MFLDSFHHVVDTFLCSICLGIIACLATKFDIVLTCHDEESGNHQRLCLGTFGIILRGLETLVRIP